MSSTRSKLQLDEQSFQGLLAAAYTIQEHADLLKPVTTPDRKIAPEASPTSPRVCRVCSAPIQQDESRCGLCGWEGSRSEPRMQPLFPPLQEHPPESDELSADTLGSSQPAFTAEDTNQPAEICLPQQQALEIEGASETDQQIAPDHAKRSDALDWLMESANLSDSKRDTLLELRQQVNHHRADLYLGLSVLVAVLVLLWPTPAPPQRPHLDTWQRVLVKLGIAEAPPTQIHYRGDPNVQVWVDPHTALYYCVGDELYGKAAGGHLTNQRDAQSDQFEPANRAICN